MSILLSDKIFVTGIGTGIGKTVVSAILAEALQADYWKPIQAGFAGGTDSEWVKAVVSNPQTKVHDEVYKLKLAASPHIAAADEKINIDLQHIADRMPGAKKLIVEGAGGLMVPLNDSHFVADLIERLDIPVVLVSRNYLGSINHSLLTAAVCRSRNIRVLGWIFNDQFMDYEKDIERWTGIPRIASIPFTDNPDKEFIQSQAAALRNKMAMS